MKLFKPVLSAVAILALTLPLAACDLGMIFEGLFGPF